MDASALPLLDHHCHALIRPGRPLTARQFRSFFTESADPEMSSHVINSLFYRRAIRDLGALLRCDPDEQTILDLRESTEATEYACRLLASANIPVQLVDTGLNPAEHLTLEEQRALLPGQFYEVLRLETLAEECIVMTATFRALEEQFREKLQGLRERGVVALKTIAAYRGGLRIQRRTRAEAREVYSDVKVRARLQGSVRLVERPLLEYLIRIGMEQAASQELPIQFHTGFGDADLDLREASPLHLRNLIEDPALQGAPIVLLHCYPFVREAAYLASIYGSVFADLSLTIPFAAHGGAQAIREMLELTPASKLLLATDAFSLPELFALGALNIRRSLQIALSGLLSEGWLVEDQAADVAQRLMYANAAALYGVTDPAFE